MTSPNKTLSNGMKICKQGHVYPSSDDRCWECKKISKKKWIMENREHYLKIKKTWRDANTKKRSDDFKAWYLDHLEEQRITKRAYMVSRRYFNIWYGMIDRCTNPKHIGFKDYGGRGITVCGRWLGKNGYEKFCEDMGEKPSPKHSLDRCDNNAGYFPENCGWATKKEQQRNRRVNRLLTFDGRTQCLTAWAEEIGIHPGTITSRLNRYGWTVDEALSIPRGNPKYHKSANIE